jgi:hypothetical protein
MIQSPGSIVRFTSSTTRKETTEERKRFANGACSNLPANYAELTDDDKRAAWAMLAAATPDDTKRGSTRPVAKGSYRAW